MNREKLKDKNDNKKYCRNKKNKCKEKNKIKREIHKQNNYKNVFNLVTHQSSKI